MCYAGYIIRRYKDNEPLENTNIDMINISQAYKSNPITFGFTVTFCIIFAVLVLFTAFSMYLQFQRLVLGDALKKAQEENSSSSSSSESSEDGTNSDDSDLEEDSNDTLDDNNFLFSDSYAPNKKVDDHTDSEQEQIIKKDEEKKEKKKKKKYKKRKKIIKRKLNNKIWQTIVLSHSPREEDSGMLFEEGPNTKDNKSYFGKQQSDGIGGRAGSITIDKKSDKDKKNEPKSPKEKITAKFNFLKAPKNNNNNGSSLKNKGNNT